MRPYVVTFGFIWLYCDGGFIIRHVVGDGLSYNLRWSPSGPDLFFLQKCLSDIYHHNTTTTGP